MDFANILILFMIEERSLNDIADFMYFKLGPLPLFAMQPCSWLIFPDESLIIRAILQLPLGLFAEIAPMHAIRQVLHSVGIHQYVLTILDEQIFGFLANRRSHCRYLFSILLQFEVRQLCVLDRLTGVI